MCMCVCVCVCVHGVCVRACVCACVHVLGSCYICLCEIFLANMNSHSGTFIDLYIHAGMVQLTCTNLKLCGNMFRIGETASKSMCLLHDCRNSKK